MMGGPTARILALVLILGSRQARPSRRFTGRTTTDTSVDAEGKFAV